MNHARLIPHERRLSGAERREGQEDGRSSSSPERGDRACHVNQHALAIHRAALDARAGKRDRKGRGASVPPAQPTAGLLVYCAHSASIEPETQLIANHDGAGW